MENNQEKKKMGVGKKLGIGCLGIIVLIIIISVLASKGGDSNTTTTGGSGSGSQETQTNKEYTLGETISLRNHTLTVKNLQQGYKSGNQFDTPQSQENEFVVVTVEFANTGTDTVDINDFGFKLEDETGTQRSTAFGGLVDGKLGVVTLSPGGKTSGKVVFEAKKSSSKLILHYSPGVFGGQAITIKLK